MNGAKKISFPSFQLTSSLLDRPIDILALGSALLEQVILVNQWPAPGGQAEVNVERMNFVAGGCAANVTCFAGRLGAQAAPICCLGDGRYSQELWNEFDRSRVLTSYVHRYPGHDGNLVIELTNREGDWATMALVDPEIMLRVDDIPPIDAFQKSKVFHVDGFCYVNAGDRRAVEKAVKLARAAGCLLSVDASVPAAQSYPDFLTWLFTQADVVFANLFEAQSVTMVDELGDVVAGLQKLGPKLAVLKLGSEGSVVITPEAVGRVPAYPVEVVDTVAAGDAYIATVLVRLIAGDSLLQATHRGSAAGALACLGPGSLSSWFTLEDIDRLIAEKSESI